MKKMKITSLILRSWSHIWRYFAMPQNCAFADRKTKTLASPQLVTPKKKQEGERETRGKRKQKDIQLFRITLFVFSFCSPFLSPLSLSSPLPSPLSSLALFSSLLFLSPCSAPAMQNEFIHMADVLTRYSVQFSCPLALHTTLRYKEKKREQMRNKRKNRIKSEKRSRRNTWNREYPSMVVANKK